MFAAIVLVVALLLSGLRIAQEYQRGVILRLGRFVGLRGPGLYWIVPLGIERATTIDVRTLPVSAEQQERARLIKAEAESEASIKLSAAAAQMMQNPAALELRRMQMISEVGAENNSTTVLMIPSDFVSLAQTLNQFLQQSGKHS